jgi:hypothetical protein
MPSAECGAHIIRVLVNKIQENILRIILVMGQNYAKGKDLGPAGRCGIGFSFCFFSIFCFLY